MPGRGPSIQVEGARELRAALKRAADDMADLKAANHDAAQIVADEAKSIVPQLTGRLSGTIRANTAKATAIVKAGGAGIPYAGVIHFGWPGHNIEPQPFLYDALDHRRDDVIAAYEKAIQPVIDRV